MWPTPNAYDWNVPEMKEAFQKRAEYQASKGVNLQKPLKTIVVHMAQEDGMEDHWKQTGSLNPTWVEWLMGYPIEHTDLKDWATPSSRKSRRKSSDASTK
jgi:hypothetical protein